MSPEPKEKPKQDQPRDRIGEEADEALRESERVVEESFREDH